MFNFTSSSFKEMHNDIFIGTHCTVRNYNAVIVCTLFSVPHCKKELLRCISLNPQKQNKGLEVQKHL